MDDETIVETETTENTENVDATTTETEAEEIDWEAKARKAEELANNYKIRAEKAEKVVKTVKPEAKQETVPGLTTRDTIAIINQKVHEDDIEEVVDIARLKGVSVADALKLNLTKSLLRDKAEQRTVAEATNTSGSRRGSSKVSDDSLLAGARSGKLPENDADIERLMRAQMGLNKK